MNANTSPIPEIERERAGTIPADHSGVVYFIGSIGRPGAVPVDPATGPTLLQALALAGGPGRHAALAKAVLIREREGGRTVTTINLKRILRGVDPDLPIRDRDIVFVPARWF
jgi:protein involved in polysaccharide export with SLBB domain